MFRYCKRCSSNPGYAATLPITLRCVMDPPVRTLPSIKTVVTFILWNELSAPPISGEQEQIPRCRYSNRSHLSNLRSYQVHKRHSKITSGHHVGFYDNSDACSVHHRPNVRVLIHLTVADRELWSMSTSISITGHHPEWLRGSPAQHVTLNFDEDGLIGRLKK